jgi:alkylation response protein AidB-like acyl-CoA dehydrogenase
MKPDDDTLRLLRESARDFCSGISLQDGRAPSSSWWKDVAELGWLAVAAPEESAGAGLGLTGAGVIAHELGRAGYTRGYAETVAVAYALQRARQAGLLDPTPALDHALQEAHSGAAQLALLQPVGPHAPQEALVPDVEAGRLLLLGLDPASGLVLHDVGTSTRQRPASSTSRARDLLLTQADAGLDEGGQFQVLAPPPHAQLVWKNAQMCERALVAAQWVGVVRTALAIASDYARIRSQFGRVIGAYQAVQHAMVDILSTCDAAELLVERALAAIDADRADQDSLADAAAAYARETAWNGLMKTYDVLGGVGFIEVHPINRYTRALMLSLARIGTASACEDATAHHVRPGHWLIA